MTVKEEGQIHFCRIFAHPGVLNKQNECSLLIHVLLLVPRSFSAIVTWHAPWWLSSYNTFWVLLNPKALYKNKTIGLIFLMKRARHIKRFYKVIQQIKEEKEFRIIFFSLSIK